MAYLHKEIYLFEGDTIIWTQLCKKYSTQLLKVVLHNCEKGKHQALFQANIHSSVHFSLENLYAALLTVLFPAQFEKKQSLLDCINS